MRAIIILAGACMLLGISGCDHKFSDIQSCILGAEKPIPLEKAIAVVKAAGLVVTSQEPAPISLTPSVSSAAAATSGPFNLLCEAAINGQRYTKTIHLDIASKAANGVVAVITEDEVKWTSGVQNPVTGKPTLEHHTLNRLNGDYRYYDDGVVYASNPPTYHCSKAPPAQF
ncbi:hypothetical protein K9857_08605 [Pseudomonas sp. REP124]|uniref:hypothetical protein n=1 Tax=Pseudomonas sp. REP124 TaxID=2875731 RepID=UPI001CCCD267|nr:hypothetical protein [Pseudomonas sp. REP124]MBZ9781611.1 hypothetical protein [Pseudomonas sp. REP124]